MTVSTKTESSEQKSSIYQLIGIEHKSPEEAHKAISTVLYSQYKTIEKLRENNRRLWLQIQERQMGNVRDEGIDTKQSVVKQIWDNKEDEFWDTF